MRAVDDSYESRTLEDLAVTCLGILSNDQLMRCGYIGGQLFPGAIHRGSAPFARQAGRVMRVMERSGWAVSESRDGWQGWRLTVAGVRERDERAVNENSKEGAHDGN